MKILKSSVMLRFVDLVWFLY